MEPRIFSTLSSSETITGNSFDHSITFSPSDGSLQPLFSSNDLSEALLFDTYIAESVAKNKRRLQTPPIDTPTPSSSERSSTEVPPLEDSPSQATITPASLRASPGGLKKKRSIGTALKHLKTTASREFKGGLKGAHRRPSMLQLENASTGVDHAQKSPGVASARGEDDEEFEDRNRTVRRRNMPHHPFRPEEVPYMQAYSQILLENDYQAHQLLCRLMRADSPSFHKWGKKPPADVLDLGCGEGFWVLHAAKLWKPFGTKVTGLDLIDLHNNEVGEVHPGREPAHVPKNVTWVRANFIKHRLPFADHSFDFVRMANLTLCIPTDRWAFVLSEVKRILRPHGRLELIDDDIFFPPIPPRPTREIPAPASPPRKQRPRTASVGDQAYSSVSTPSPLSRSWNSKQFPTFYPLDKNSGKKGHKRTASDAEYSSNTAVASHLETAFEKMLSSRYNISMHPHTFLEKVLGNVFGSASSRQIQHLDLAVPSRELSERCENAGIRPPSTPPNTAQSTPSSNSHGKHAGAPEEERHKIEKREKRTAAAAAAATSAVPVRIPPPRTHARKGSEDAIDPRVIGALSPKVRQLLFGDDGDDDAARRRAALPYQPPGLVLLPSTLLPCRPLELEMHACRHMNTLLGCRYALIRHLCKRGADGKRVVSDQEVDDFLWDYECFRRRRFNWPQDIPELKMEEEAEETQLSSPAKAYQGLAIGHGPGHHLFRSVSRASPPATPISASGFGASAALGGVSGTRESSTLVRTIRVYEAVKTPCQHCACHCNC